MENVWKGYNFHQYIPHDKSPFKFCRTSWLRHFSFETPPGDQLFIRPVHTGLISFHRVCFFVSFQYTNTPMHQHPNTNTQHRLVLHTVLDVLCNVLGVLRNDRLFCIDCSCTGHRQHLLANVTSTSYI